MNITFSELVQLVSQILPDAIFSEDASGELVISTGLKKVHVDDNQPLEKAEE